MTEVRTLALSIGTTVIIKMGKARYAFITVVPMLFMAVTTLTASYQLIVRFWASARAASAKASSWFWIYSHTTTGSVQFIL